MNRPMPQFPVYIPSKGRSGSVHTARMFSKDGVPFRIVVEPSQVEAYEKVWGRDALLVMEENDRGLVYARNWITDHARASGAKRHWQFDDDIRAMIRHHDGLRLPTESNIALRSAEDFVEQYENVGVLSFNSEFFVPMSNGVTAQKWPPFYLNSRCYTCMLFLNALPNRWRGPYNEDTDMSLQVLSSGWCTILINAFTIRTLATMTIGGGQTGIYVGDGRLKMSRNLERRWPGVITTYRRFGRAQHKVAMFWRQFAQSLKRIESAPRGNGEYGLQLVAVKTVKDPELRAMVEAQAREAAE